MRKAVIFAIAAIVVFSSSRPVKVACIGDSITYGSQIENKSEDSYPAVLQKLLGEGYEVTNYGKSARVMLQKGDNPYGEDPNCEAALSSLPDIVTIMLGTNDSKPHNWVYGDDFEHDYVALIDRFRKLPTHPTIYICMPPWVAESRWGINDSTLVSAINPLILKVAARRWLEVVDTRTPFVGKPELFADGVHPNEEGARIIAQAVYDCMERNGDTAGQGKRVVFIGDSITDGFWGRHDGKASVDRDHYDKNHVYGHSYMANCAAYYQARYPQRNYKFYNRGISGGTLRGMEPRWEEDVLDVNPDVVSVYVGINDANHNPENLDFAAWEALYRSLLDRTLEHNPNVRFVLCTPFVAPLGAISRKPQFPAIQSTVEHLAEIVRRLADDYDAALVPFDTEMEKLLRTDRSGNCRYWTWDGVHPTYAGHVKFSELWIRKANRQMR